MNLQPSLTRMMPWDSPKNDLYDTMVDLIVLCFHRQMLQKALSGNEFSALFALRRVLIASLIIFFVNQLLVQRDSDVFSYLISKIMDFLVLWVMLL